MHIILNKLLINLLACGLILTSSVDATHLMRAVGRSGEAQEKWTTFTSKESGFSVKLPKTPEHVHQKIDVPKTDLSIEYDTYISEPNDSVVYVISVWHYPAQVDMSKPEVNLQDGFNGMLAALPGSQVITMHMTEVQGYKALEFLVKSDEIYFQGKLILLYNTLFQVFTVYKSSEDMKSNYDTFINSFELVHPEKNMLAPLNSAKKMSV